MLQKQHSTFKNWEDFKKMTPKEPVLMRQQRDQKEPTPMVPKQSS